ERAFPGSLRRRRRRHADHRGHEAGAGLYFRQRRAHRGGRESPAQRADDPGDRDPAPRRERRKLSVPRTAREYITLDATGRDPEACDRIRGIERAIRATFGERVAYQILRLDTRRRIKDELRDPESILKVSGGRLPVLLVNVTYDPGELGPWDFAALEARF